MSSYDVAKKANNEISATTITKIINGETNASSIKTLAAIAKGLDIEQQNLFNVAMGLPPRPARYNIYAERLDGKDLHDTEWDFLENYFKMYVQGFRESKAQRDEHIKKMIADSLDEPAASDEKVIARIGSPKTERKKAA